MLSPLPTKKNAETADEMCPKFTRCSPRCQLGGVFRPGSMSASHVVDVARWGDPPASHGFCSAERPLRLRQALDEHCWLLTLNTPEIGVVRRRAKKTTLTVSLDCIDADEDPTRAPACDASPPNLHIRLLWQL